MKSGKDNAAAVAPLRVGAVPYLVAKPLLYDLGDAPGISLEREVPSRLVARLREGGLDVALASSIEFFRRPGYRFVPDLCIGCDGEVLSVRLFLRKPWNEIRSIALDPSSETAATLLRILVMEKKNEGVEWLALVRGDDPRQSTADAFLLIGDEALREYNRAKWESIDLGAAWKEMTGLPFVFALWIVRSGVEVKPYIPAFHEAATRGIALRRHLALQGARESGIPFSVVNRYLLECCRYRLGENERRSLHEFRDRASRLGLCESGIELI